MSELSVTSEWTLIVWVSDHFVFVLAVGSESCIIDL